jgi:protein ImuB
MSREAPRLCALHLPDLPVQRLARGRDRDEPLAAIADGAVVACDAAARAAGVRPGMSAAEAHAVCGRLHAVPHAPAADLAALRGLAEVLLAIAPAVEVAGPDLLLLDASAAHLVAPPACAPRSGGGAGPCPATGGGRSPGPGGRAGDLATSEHALAERALALAAEAGFTARAAVASGRGPAGTLARSGGLAGARNGLEEAGSGGGRGGRVLHVAHGEAARALASLPLAALGLGRAVEAGLLAAGAATAGDVARLPEGTLAQRFGAEGARAARLARGEDPTPLVPFVPDTLPEEGLDLEGPAESAEPLLFALKRLADRVAARLAGRGLGASRLKVTLKLDPRGEERLVVPLAAPTAAAGRWLGPVREHLATLRLPAPVTGVRLAATEVAVVAAEQLAFGDRPEVISALEGVLARLAGRLGDGAVFAAEPVERYRPEGAYRAVAFRAPRAGGARTAAAGPPGDARPTRLLAAPEPVVAEGEGGRLTALRVGGQERAVRSLEGPERLSGEWWSSPFDRDYYRVALEGLGDCWIFRDGADGRLYLHGFFD